jgi:hypothetical protein
MVPKLSVIINGDEIGNELVVGQIAKLELTLKNRSLVALKSLAFYRNDEISTKLVEPEAEDVFGQCRLRPLLPGEELKLVIALSAEKQGNYDLNLLFPYWADALSPRLDYLQRSFVVLPRPEFNTLKSHDDILLTHLHPLQAAISPKKHRTILLYPDSPPSETY